MFWEEQEQVERFAARAPDVRLQGLVPDYSDPASVRVLDVGCAAGRNALFLGERGFDVWAVDSSRAMVEKTRSRLAPIFGADEARRRVREGAMDQLDWGETATFDLVVALGIYHCAGSRDEWRRALSESARVLKPLGLWLISVFTPETDLTGQGVRRVSAEDPLYEGYPGGRLSYLVDAATLDAEVARYGFRTHAPTETVRRATGAERRVSVNGLYIKSL